MAKKYARPIMPPEFKRWIEERRRNMERIAREAGKRESISLVKTMRMISQTNGVNLPEEVVRQLQGKRKC